MASFDNYTDLQTTILNWMGRPGDPLLPVTDFITLFETDASRRLRTHFQEEQSTITTVPGTASYNLPADFLQVRELVITSTTPNFTVSYMPPGLMDDTWAIDQNDQPFNYTLEDDQIRFAPVPDGVYTMRLDYMGAVPFLAAQESGSNWLLANWPDLYLWGCLVEAETFLGADSGDDRATMFMQRREAAYQAIEKAERKYRVGGAPLVMKIVGSTP